MKHKKLINNFFIFINLLKNSILLHQFFSALLLIATTAFYIYIMHYHLRHFIYQFLFALF